MRIYAFESADPDLSLLPMAARRALDAAGLRLSLEAWRQLPSAARRALTDCGSASNVDVPRVSALLTNVAAERIEPRPEAPPDAPPPQVIEAFGAELPIPASTWAALAPLDRYVLAKLGGKRKDLDRQRLERAHAEIVGASATSSHLQPAGGVRMVGVGAKPLSERCAVAESRITLSRAAFTQLTARTAAKGDVLATARVAAIAAAKKTPDLIPLCHQVALTKVQVEFELLAESAMVVTQVTAHAVDRTGVEMEALTAASVASLTIYDMLKSQDRAMEIGPTRLLSKHGGRTGDYRR